MPVGLQRTMFCQNRGKMTTKVKLASTSHFEFGNSAFLDRDQFVPTPGQDVMATRSGSNQLQATLAPKKRILTIPDWQRMISFLLPLGGTLEIGKEMLEKQNYLPLFYNLKKDKNFKTTRPGSVYHLK